MATARLYDEYNISAMTMNKLIESALQLLQPSMHVLVYGSELQVQIYRTAYRATTF
jgi:hypothetical protein